MALALSSCGARAARHGGQVPVPAATTAGTQTPGANPAGTGGTAGDLNGVDSDLSTLNSSLSDIDNQLKQADQAADADN